MTWNYQPVGERRMIREKLTRLWEQAYRDGQAEVDFSSQPEAGHKAQELFNMLCNFRTILKRRPADRVPLLNIVESITLCRPKNGKVRLVRRRKLARQTIRTAVLRDDLPVTGTDRSPSKEILQNMKKSLVKSLHQSEESI